MPVSLQDVEHIAQLARLNFSDAEKEMFTRDLNEILAYMEKLNELDTSAVEPLSRTIELFNVFRDDVTIPPLDRDEALRNAPDKTDEFFKVPKVIDR
jgi:aspartyl-tRNA(Asn)/glutamyl-tRNA(Gln) amidotransferase subunit C